MQGKKKILLYIAFVIVDQQYFMNSFASNSFTTDVILSKSLSKSDLKNEKFAKNRGQHKTDSLPSVEN